MRRKSGPRICEIEGFASVPKIQIVTIEDAMKLHDRSVRLPARVDSFKKPAREEDATRQKAMDL